MKYPLKTSLKFYSISIIIKLYFKQVEGKRNG
nr:MAG TPA: hypothetical protein [Caudoviricetes sp.]